MVQLLRHRGRQVAGPAADRGRASELVGRIGDVLFRRRNLLFPVVLGVLLIGVAPACHEHGALGDPLTDVAGAMVALTGQALRVAVIGYAYIQRGGRKGRVYAARLVREGFFAHSRNPLYLGNLLILTGLFLVHGNPWVVVLGPLWCFFAYRAIVASEERYLHQKFGAEYEDYCRTVRRWIPDFRGLRRSLAACRFDWRRVVLKEYTSAYLWSVSLVLLLGYQRMRCGAPAWSPGDATRIAAPLTLLTCGWLAARYFKKGSLLASRA